MLHRKVAHVFFGGAFALTKAIAIRHISNHRAHHGVPLHAGESIPPRCAVAEGCTGEPASTKHSEMTIFEAKEITMMDEDQHGDETSQILYQLVWLQSNGIVSSW